MERRAVRFEGRVQGVGFRMTCRTAAARHPAITGWVRNEPDGSVSLELQGEPDEIDAVLHGVRETTHGGIDRESSEALDPVPDERGFEIRH